MRPKLFALLASITLFSTLAPAAAQDAPPTPPVGRRRARPANQAKEKDRGPVVNAVGFDKTDDGGTKIFVEISRKVSMSESRLGNREVVYTLIGTHVGSFNDTLPIDARYQNTPLLRARLTQKKKDVEVHVVLRADVKPTAVMTDLDGGRTLLTISFAAGSYVKEETPPTTTTTTGTTPPAQPAPPLPPRTAPPPGKGNPHADDPDYVPRAGTEETADGRTGKSKSGEEPDVPRDGRWGLGFLGGYGIGDTSNGAPNIYGAGVGARVGYTFGVGAYVGALFVYHLGASQTVDQVTAKDTIILGGAEFGYDILAGPLVIRPSIDIGVANFHGSASGGGQSTSTDKQYMQLAPGATLLYTFGAGFIGVDARYWVITGVDTSTTLNSPNAFGIYGTLGAMF